MNHPAIDTMNRIVKPFPQMGKLINEGLKLKEQLDPLPPFQMIHSEMWQVVYALAKGMDPSKDASPTDLRKAQDLEIVGTWRFTQGIYKFDKELAESLLAAPLEGSIPSSVLERLPEWCVYVDTSRLFFDAVRNEDILGFWAMLIQTNLSNTDAPTKILHILLHFPSRLTGIILPISYAGDENLTIERAIELTANIAIRSPKVMERMKEDPDYRNAVLDFQKQFTSACLSLLLYICSNEPDIQDKQEPGSYPSFPALKRIKKDWTLFYAKRPRIWTVGERIYNRIREERKSLSHDGSERRTHVRRAHWHGYWKGPKDNAQFIFHWIPTMVVGKTRLLAAV